MAKKKTNNNRNQMWYIIGGAVLLFMFMNKGPVTSQQQALTPATTSGISPQFDDCYELCQYYGFSQSRESGGICDVGESLAHYTFSTYINLMCCCYNAQMQTTTAADNDGDGIPDSQDADDDNDGFTDTQEQQAGTDSKNPNSKPSASCDSICPSGYTGRFVTSFSECASNEIAVGVGGTLCCCLSPNSNIDCVSGPNPSAASDCTGRGGCGTGKSCYFMPDMMFGEDTCYCYDTQPVGAKSCSVSITKPCYYDQMCAYVDYCSPNTIAYEMTWIHPDGTEGGGSGGSSLNGDACYSGHGGASRLSTRGTWTTRITCYFRDGTSMTNTDTVTIN